MSYGPPHASTDDAVFFESPYGAMPKFILYVPLPIVIVVPIGLWVAAVYFGLEIELARNLTLTPQRIVYFVCPVFWGLAALIGFAEMYYRLFPQRIAVTESGLRLPRKRFSSDEVHIRWADLEASMTGYSNDGYDFYEIKCNDPQQMVMVRIQSMLFRNFDDFATLAMMIGERQGEDWSIKGFLPGTIRGKRDGK